MRAPRGSAASTVGDAGGGRAGRHVAPVGEAVEADRDAGRRPARAPAPPHGPGARGRRPGTAGRRRWQVPPDARRASMNRSQGGIRRQRTVRDGGVDARQILQDYAARPDIEMSDLGIAHLPLGQADIGAEGPSAAPGGGRASAASKTGVWACWTALSATSSRRPQPSRITSITGRGVLSGTVTTLLGSARAAGTRAHREAGPVRVSIIGLAARDYSRGDEKWRRLREHPHSDMPGKAARRIAPARGAPRSAALRPAAGAGAGRGPSPAGLHGRDRRPRATGWKRMRAGVPRTMDKLN